MHLLENLLQTLREEQMYEAVLHIAREILLMGKDRKNKRFIAFANLIIGEVLIQQYQDDPQSIKDAEAYLSEANIAYTTDATILNDEEYGRVAISLSSVYRLLGDPARSKLYLELAKEKTKDKNLLL